MQRDDMTFLCLTVIKCQIFSYMEEDMEHVRVNNFAEVENTNS